MTLFFSLLILMTSAFAQLPSKDHQFESSLSTLIDNATKPDVVPGMVVASPSKNDPDYYFDWVRDTALVMRTLVDYWEITNNPRIKQLLITWVATETFRQNLPSLGGLGEPKYNVNGTPYSGPWGRPQNDGPALRALTMIKFARLLIDKGELDYVKKHLYSSPIPAELPIKKDLEYTAHNWKEPNFDPWEEEKGMHFYNLLAQHTALQEGSLLAFELGDGGAASFYKMQSEQIGHYIKNTFLDDTVGIYVSKNVVQPLGYKNSGIDVAPLLALNHTWPYQKLIPLNSPSVKKYVSTLIASSIQSFPVNRDYPDMGVAIGRYPEDRYNGYTTSGTGNPWFLATLSLGEHYCLVNGGKLTDKAEKQFLRVLFHSDRNGRLDEQFNRHTGLIKGPGN